MEAKAEKVELKDKYRLVGYGAKSKIAQFCNSRMIPSNTAFFFIRLPKTTTSKGEVEHWLNQEGEDSVWIDVDLIYKLLERARRWKEIQDDYGPDHP